ncbi:MAG: flagellar hook-basal body complex protein, partial [Phenylobacterium sp.]
MSISSALRAGVSGLLANSSALAAISDNISNVNTTAYKRHTVSFGSIVTSQYLDGRYSAGGVSAQNRSYVSQQGLIQAADSSTDMAISGEGFFIVSQKGLGLTDTDARFFTRAGSFTVDSDGYLVNDSGYYLQGWPILPDGTVDRSPSDVTRLMPINVRNLGSAVAKTTDITIDANINKDQAAPAVAYAANAFRSYAADPTTGQRPQFIVELSVIDSAGGTRRLEMAMSKAAAPAVNTWNAEIYAVPTTDIQGGGQIAGGQLRFNTNGTIDLANTTLFGAAGSPAVLNIGASGGAAPAWSTLLGVEANTVTLDMSGVTQYS